LLVFMLAGIGCVKRVSTKAEALPDRIKNDDAPVCLVWQGGSQLGMIGRDIARTVATLGPLGAAIAKVALPGEIEITWREVTIKGKPGICGPQSGVIQVVRMIGLAGLPGVWQFYDYHPKDESIATIPYAAQTIVEVKGEMVDGCGEVKTEIAKARIGGKTAFEWVEKLCLPKSVLDEIKKSQEEMKKEQSE
jgi:hypothetical protein